MSDTSWRRMLARRGGVGARNTDAPGHSASAITRFGVERLGYRGRVTRAFGVLEDVVEGCE